MLKPGGEINGPWRICSRLLCSKCCFVGTNQKHTGKRYFSCHFFRPNEVYAVCPVEGQTRQNRDIYRVYFYHYAPRNLWALADLQQWCFVVVGASTERRRISKSLFATQSLRGLPRGNTSYGFQLSILDLRVLPRGNTFICESLFSLAFPVYQY